MGRDEPVYEERRGVFSVGRTETVDVGENVRGKICRAVKLLMEDRNASELLSMATRLLTLGERETEELSIVSKKLWIWFQLEGIWH